MIVVERRPKEDYHVLDSLDFEPLVSQDAL